MQAQQQQLERAEAGYHRSTARLREMQEQMQRHGGAMNSDTDGSRLLDLLRDDVTHLRHQVSKGTHVLGFWAIQKEHKQGFGWGQTRQAAGPTEG
jgi:hypothetical protein